MSRFLQPDWAVGGGPAPGRQGGVRRRPPIPFGTIRPPYKPDVTMMLF